MKQIFPLTRYGRVISTLIALSVGLVTSAKAATILAFITTGDTAISETLVNADNTEFGQTTYTAPAGGWTDAFALATTASNLYVGNAGGNSIQRYVPGTAAISANFTLPSDGSGISPQEIALDNNGNLYITSPGSGNITEWANGNNTSATVIQNLPNARGILIDGNRTYVDTSAVGSGKVYEFATGTTDAPTLIYTTGAYQDGQLRGMAIDSSGNLYIADSGWASNGSAGYIEELTNFGLGGNVTATTFIAANATNGLDDPNSLAIGTSSGSGADTDLYVANYGDGSVTDYSLTTGAEVNSWLIASNTSGHVQGIAFDSSEGGDPADPAPEPGTGTLLLLASLFTATVGFYCRKVRTRQPCVENTRS